MKQILHFLTFVLFLGFSTSVMSQELFRSDNTAEYGFTDFENRIDILDESNCTVPGNEFTYEIEVSGVGQIGGDWILNNVSVGFLYGDFNGYIDIEAPDGQRFILAEESQGSFTDYDPTVNNFDLSFQSCNLGFPQTTDPGSWTSTPFAAQVMPIQDINELNLSGINVDGIWRIIVCNDPFVNDFHQFYRFSIRFANVCPNIAYNGDNEPILDITNASDCNSADGAFSLALWRGACNVNMEVDYIINAGAIETLMVENGTQALIEKDNLQAGVYSLEVFIDDNCSNFFNITIPGNDDCPLSFGSPVCSSPDPIGVFGCDIPNGILPVQADVFVSGLNNLSPDYGLKSVFLELYYPGPVSGYVDLIAPDGSRYPLIGEGSFPNYNGLNDGLLSIFLADCEQYLPHDINTNYVPGTTYRPIGSLQAINDAGISPNGNWTIEACNGDFNSIAEIHCFGLDIAKPDAPSFIDCPADFTVELGPDGTATFDFTDPLFTTDCVIDVFSANVTLSGLINASYEMAPGQTFPYTVSGAGEVVFDYVLEDINGETYTCTTVVTISQDDPCANDTQAPVLENCPVDFTVEIEEGEANWSVTEPSFTDNCGIASAKVFITLSDGSMQDFDISPGTSFTYASITEGTVTYDWVVTDDSGNEGSCQTLVEIVNLVAVGDVSSLESLNIFPTVTSDAVSIEADLNEANVMTINVMDAQGRLIDTIITDGNISINQQLDVSDLQSGVYFINMEIAGESLTRRIVKI